MSNLSLVVAQILSALRPDWIWDLGPMRHGRAPGSGTKVPLMFTAATPYLRARREGERGRSKQKGTEMRSRTATKACMGAALGLLLAGSAQAQDHRFEIGGTAGFSSSDGVTFSGVLAGDGNLYNGIEPKDSFSWSVNIG